MKKILLGLMLCLTLVGCSNQTVEQGDIVQIDFVGFMDGKEFEGGSANDAMVQIGSGQFIPGFEEGIIGMKKGETKDVKMKFPAEYTPELANKDVTFKITVDEVYRKL